MFSSSVFTSVCVETSCLTNENSTSPRSSCLLLFLQLNPANMRESGHNHEECKRMTQGILIHTHTHAHACAHTCTRMHTHTHRALMPFELLCLRCYKLICKTDEKCDRSYSLVELCEALNVANTLESSHLCVMK